MKEILFRGVVETVVIFFLNGMIWKRNKLIIAVFMRGKGLWTELQRITNVLCKIEVGENDHWTILAEIQSLSIM